MTTASDFLAAEFTRGPADATCWFCPDTSAALVIASDGARFPACTAHTRDAFATIMDLEA